MKSFFTGLLVLVFCISLKAQDQHFTQVYNAPLALNPALTGSYAGTYRFSGIYRDQWRRTLDDPYVTFAGMLDVRFPLEVYNGKYNDAVAIGLMFYNDKVPGVDFNTNQIALSAAYHKALDLNNTQYISLGIQGGINQRNINYEDLTFDDEYNGTTGFFNPTREILPGNNFSFDDWAIGLNYAFIPGRRTSFYAGLSLHHIFEPQVSFFPTDTDIMYEGNTLFRKFGAQVSASIPLSDKYSIQPRLVGSLQGPHFQAVTGSNVRIALSEYDYSALHIGGWVRPVRNFDDSFSLDAAIIMLGIEYRNILFGLSYDATLVDLQTTRRGQGAFEFSVSYSSNTQNESLLCPKF